MRRLLLIHFAAWGLLSVLTTQGVGQLIVVRPGFVKAPFVRVYSYPDGSSYVRAPFVGVRSPGYASHPQYVGGRPIPNADEFARMDWLSLRRTIRTAAGGLNAELSRFPTGEVWKTHLHTSTILQLFASDVDGPPTIDEQNQIWEILPAFDAASTGSDLRAITNLANFQVLHAALREYAQPPQQRLAWQLSRGAQSLNRALGRFDTGAGWQEYLAFPKRFDGTDEVQTIEPAEPDRGALEELQRVADRFDSIRQQHEYRMIAGLPEFEATYELLAAYLESLRDSPVNPRVEELPAPQPVNP